MSANNRISTIVESQLPEFIRADHPNFVALVKKYYEYLEQSGKTLEVNKSLPDYADVDLTRSDLIQYFKNKIIKNFPDQTELSKEKIIKAAREFYQKKGTAESFKFLFKVIYGLDIDVYLPKDDILKASDGKWKLPQAIRLSISDSSSSVVGGNVNVFVTTANTVNANGINLVSSGITANSYIRIGTEKRKVLSVNTKGDFLRVDIPFANTGNSQIYDSQTLYKVTINQYANFDITLLNKRKAVGENSRTSCIIERAVRSVDKDTGYEIAELYVSNVNKLFENGENLLIDYVDENGLSQTFTSKIISLISNIKLYRNRFGVVQTGKNYNTGDPVSVIGGLATGADDTVKAVAMVNNVSTGSILTVETLDSGYYFRANPNSMIRVYSNTGIASNIEIFSIWDDGGANSDYFVFNTDAIAYKSTKLINDSVSVSNDMYSFANVNFNTIRLSRPINLPGTATVNIGAASANVYVTANLSNNTTPSFNVAYGNTITIGSNTFLVNVVAANGLQFTVNTLSNVAYTFTSGVSANLMTKIDLSSDYTSANQSTTRVNINSATFIANTVQDYYKSYILQVVGGKGSTASPNSSLILGSNANGILNLSTALGSALDGTSNVQIRANAQTQIGKALSYSNIVMGKIRSLTVSSGGSFFAAPPVIDAFSVHDTDYSLDQSTYVVIPGSTTAGSAQFSNYNYAGDNPTIRLNSSNNSYSLANGYYTGLKLWLDVGETSHFVKIIDYIVENSGTSSNTKTLVLDGKFENNITPINITRYNLLLDLREDVRNTGRLGKVLVVNGGSGYSGTDIIEFIGTGYGAAATVSVDGSGKITSATLTNRGEAYYSMPTVRVLNSSGGATSGANATFKVIGLSDGEDLAPQTDSIGKIQDFEIVNRGFDYANTPYISLKNMDVLTNDLSKNQIVLEGQIVWQGGTTWAGASFKGYVDEVYRPNADHSIIRIYDYSGLVNTALPLKINTASGNISVTPLLRTDSISFNGINPASSKTYPYYYGNGLAKANAEFLNGLIRYNGFYLNSDGFISADKKLQNKDYYHNFSYEIQSESSLEDYRDTIYRVAHPAGMQLLSKYLIKDLWTVDATVSSNLHYSNTQSTTNSNTSYSSNVLYGNSSNFLANAAIGDLIVINTTSSASQRQYTRLVTNVVDNNTLWLESPIGGVGDGRIRVTTGNANVFVYSNVYSVSESLAIDDNISFNISGTTYRKQIVALTGNVVQLNTTTGLAEANVLYQKTPVYNVASYTIIKTSG